MRKTALDCVHKLSKIDERVVFIGSDLGPGVLDKMKTDIGIVRRESISNILIISATFFSIQLVFRLFNYFQ